MFRRALILALLAPCAAAAETAVHMPPVGFRYTAQGDVESTPASGVASKHHFVFHRDVVASDGTTIETRGETTADGSDDGRSTSTTTTYRLFLLTGSESTSQPAKDKPPITMSYTLECPAGELDQFYPRGAAPQISVTCEVTTRFANRQAIGPKPMTAAFSDLGSAQDKTPAGAFDVRKIMVRLENAGGTNEITYDFAPALGISVRQETKVSTSFGGVVTRYEVTEIAPAP